MILAMQSGAFQRAWRSGRFPTREALRRAEMLAERSKVAEIPPGGLARSIDHPLHGVRYEMIVRPGTSPWILDDLIIDARRYRLLAEAMIARVGEGEGGTAGYWMVTSDGKEWTVTAQGETPEGEP